MKRLEERSIFLESRMKISDECKFVISKLMESFLLSQKHGFEISDITFRRKNLTEEVQLFFFSFLYSNFFPAIHDFFLKFFPL